MQINNVAENLMKNLKILGNNLDEKINTTVIYAW